MSKDYRVYLDNILDSIRRIEEYTKRLSSEEFTENQMVSDAVIRNLEIIGEAVKNMPQELKNKHPKFKGSIKKMEK